MSKVPSVPKSLRIPAALYETICSIQKETGLNEHALLLELLQEGVEARVAGDTQERLKDMKRKVSHMGAELNALFKRKG